MRVNTNDCDSSCQVSNKCWKNGPVKYSHWRKNINMLGRALSIIGRSNWPSASRNCVGTTSKSISYVKNCGHYKTLN
ncbi:hypothetical protein D3C87_1915480 [compost metagenome]